MIKILTTLSMIFVFNTSLLAISDIQNESEKLIVSNPVEEHTHKTIETTQNIQDPKTAQLKTISFSYLAANGIVPTLFGYGYRHQKGKHGYDIAGSISPVALIQSKMNYYSYNFRSSYLRYFSPHKKNNSYIGLGANTIANINKYYNVLRISPSFFWGKQFNGKTSANFFQLQIMWLNNVITRSKESETHVKVKKTNVFLHLFLNLNYGFGF